MKLTETQIAYIRTIVSTANTFGIDTIGIDRENIRGMSDRIFILHPNTSLDLEFDSIILNRLPVFNSRLELVQSLPNFSIEVTTGEHDTGNDNKYTFVKSLKMKGKGTNVDYRCGHPGMFKAPKSFNDPVKYEFTLPSEAITLLRKAHSAMNASEITIKYEKENELSLVMEDLTGDSLVHTFETNVINLLEDEFAPFSHKFAWKDIQPIIKDPPEFIRFNQKGFLNVIYNGINVYILPFMG